jgi:hypothetical protein
LRRRSVAVGAAAARVVRSSVSLTNR